MILARALGWSEGNPVVRPVVYRSASAVTWANSGKVVDPERARGVATAYRAVNIISDDIAKMPLQLFRQEGEIKVRVLPDGKKRNISYLLEICPNVWGWTPFQLKKNLAQWLLLYGNAYVWKAPVPPNQLLVLGADVTFPVFGEAGEVWYRTFLGGREVYLPGAEVLHTLINPDNSGHYGRGVIEYARDAIGRQIGAYDTEDKLFRQGLTPAAYLQVAGNLGKDGRKEYRDSYGEVMNGDYEGIRLAVFDNRITKFEPITMKLVDAQFLELMGATDKDIANFFGMPLHMLNMGNQSYSSNEQKYLEYLDGTLDSYLVQIEQGARIKWLSMDAKGRAETNEILIRSGQRTPNEARSKDDYSPYTEGDSFFMTKNYSDVSKLDAGGGSDPNGIF